MPTMQNVTSRSDFPFFALSDDHEELRHAVRAICDDKIAPIAAAIDHAGEFPQASYDALRAGDFHAPHIAEQYGGVGADALATCVVICLLYASPSPRDQRGSRMPSSA